ncbi:hypothetical protein PT974_07474 [Cladobotryum mycophilum]|uniref:C2H2-type domain-containing protein n=1 Tax=Cladobotryum mycophilum TaxID=491253 RepID=A0ABR0SPK6_9HYPO
MPSCGCGRTFKNSTAVAQHRRDGADQHLRDKVHKVGRPKGPYCEECKRRFKHENALQQHMDSVVHRPISRIQCIAQKDGCEAKFSCPSAMIHHLESGRCSSGLDRERLNSLIIKHDTDRAISGTDSVFQMLSGSALASGLTSPGAWTPSTETGGVLLTPASSETTLPSLLNTALVSYANTPSEDGSLHCPLCPPDHREFATSQGLRNHINSPAHALKIFHCPLNILNLCFKNRRRHKEKHFSTLSGLAQHLESGACVGGASGLEVAAMYMENELNSRGLSVKLLC